MFLNWVCGLEHQGIASSVRKSTLVIVSDEESEKLANSANFVTVKPDWLLSDKNIDITKDAAESFGWGSHHLLVSLQIVYAYDMISLGYNVIHQDTDIVWLKDVRQYFEQNNPASQFLDLQMSFDGRLDAKGPGNSGFVRIRSTCKSKIFLQTLIKYIGITLWSTSDQYLWDIFVMEYHFRQLLYELLPITKFVNGHQWDPGRSLHDHKLSHDIWSFHASWSETHIHKITKFKMVDAWFFNDTCVHYKPELMPNHSEPHHKIPEQQRNWTDNQIDWWSR